MRWGISFSKSSVDFVETENITEEDVVDVVKKAILKFQGDDLNVDIKKLKGKWFGFYRIRIGKIRVVVEFDFDSHSAFVERIDWRGSVYK